MPDEDDLRKLEDTELKFVPVTLMQLVRAVAQVESCEKCNSESEIPFDSILRRLIRAQDDAEYILPAPGRCPNCRADIHEKTLVQPKPEAESTQPG
jgi:hypothetical protein